VRREKEKEGKRRTPSFFLSSFFDRPLPPLSLFSPPKNAPPHTLQPPLPGVQQAPRRAREVVQRAQQNAAAARLARGLAAEREAKVDVQVRFFFPLLSLSLSLSRSCSNSIIAKKKHHQVGPELYEDDEQELRSRMWVAILEDDSLFGSVAPPAEGEEEESVSEGGGESKGESEDDDEHEAAPGSASEAEEEEGAEQQFLRRAEAEAKEEEEKGPSASAPSPRSASAAAPALPVDQTATAAAAEAAAEAAADPWEMVQGSSNLYPASSESKLRKENGKREIANESKKTAAATATAAETTKKRSKTSSKKKTKKPKKPKSLSARVLDAVDSVPWPLSTEYPENGRYNHLVSAPFPPGDDTDDAVGRDIGRTFPEHPQVREKFFFPVDLFRFFFFPLQLFSSIFFLSPYQHLHPLPLPLPTLPPSSATPTAAPPSPASSAPRRWRTRGWATARGWRSSPACC